MKYLDAKKYLKVGMKIKILASKCCPGAVGNVDRIESIESNGDPRGEKNWGGVHVPGTNYPESEEIEILTEADGVTPWKNPDWSPEIYYYTNFVDKDWSIHETVKCANDFLSNYYTNFYDLPSKSTESKSERKSFMRKLSELAASIRRTFSADQKALWRTGRIDDCGKLSAQGQSEVLADMAEAYFKEHIEEFVSRANEELEIAEEEKE